jgi:hypothetical protein
MLEKAHQITAYSYMLCKSPWNKRIQPMQVVYKVVFLTVCAVFTTSCTPKPPAQTINNLVGRCVTAMVNNTCRVMQNSGQSLVPQGVETVFVAGIGPIDAKLYASLRESGQAMCDNVRRACEESWQGNACKTAQALYPEVAKN